MRTDTLGRIITCVALLCCHIAGTAEAQWAQTAGPYGGQIRALALSGTDVYAGTNGGVYHTSNNGTSWNARGLGDKTIFAIAFSGSTMFAGGEGVARSTDGGLTWTDISSGLTNTNVRSLCVQGSYIFAGTVWQHCRATYNLVTLFRVDTKIHAHIHRLGELDHRKFFNH